MKLIATQKLAIGYDELVDPERPDGPKVVVTYKKGQQIDPEDRPIANLQGLIDQGYVQVVQEEES
jgi:hypothetical protein